MDRREGPSIADDKGICTNFGGYQFPPILAKTFVTARKLIQILRAKVFCPKNHTRENTLFFFFFLPYTLYLTLKACYFFPEIFSLEN